MEVESAPQFHPLAAKAASISLSSFGPGGPFSFDSFLEMEFTEEEAESSKKKNRLLRQILYNEAMGNEWLETGNCPIAKSYRAVSGVLPLVASAFQLPPGMKLKCPPAVVAARAALARTAFVKTVRPQPLSSKMLVIGALGMAANVPLGIWREHTESSHFIMVYCSPCRCSLHSYVEKVTDAQNSYGINNCCFYLGTGHWLKSRALLNESKSREG
ncbi:hypothetical protein HAX54_034368 [Datura stramonium]|uniref:Uncharacterized protein n=1 Tax=Datura stramonium TaxID=4076 RepID=A0ABS8SE76_DATST|nr:hypothetical protein [Datura stramonium]